MTLGFRTDDFSFLISCGFPEPHGPFRFDPEIKEEFVWFGNVRKPTTTLLDRGPGITRIRDVDGNRVEYPLVLGENESVLSQLREPHRFPELFAIREELRGWRFYHTFRTDEDSPLRHPRISVRTPVLSHDGSDLAAALLTIFEIGDGRKLNQVVSHAFPGRTLEILTNEDHSPNATPRSMELSVGLCSKDSSRPLLARELSDGTLKFLCLAASLLSPRPPQLIALNEPESSLHPDLLPSLAELIVYGSERSQIWVSTHSSILAENIQKLSALKPIHLSLVNGETVIDSDQGSDQDNGE
jgi:predicted ATPase